VQPLGRCSLYIIYRANLLALAALDTYIGIDGKLLVVYHLGVEVVADHIGIESGSGAFHQFRHAGLLLADGADDVGQLLAGCGYLALFFLNGVGLHEWQAYIALRHDDGKLCGGFQSYLFQVFVQDGHRLAHVITTGGERPTEMALMTELELSDKLSYQAWWLPAVSGETKTDCFAFLE